jgi:hypothetical protein
MRSQNGLLLKDTAVLEGQLIDVASKKLDPVTSDLEMCATFTAVGRGKNGPRTEVRDGRLYVYEAVRTTTPSERDCRDPAMVDTRDIGEAAALFLRKRFSSIGSALSWLAGVQPEAHLKR